MVRSVIILSQEFHVHEYLVSFFVVAIGTSIPELVVELQALRKKQYQLAIGDAIGSCLVDASFAIGIGQLFFPQKVSGELARVTGLYAMLGSIIVIVTLALREKLDRKAGTLFIALYILSYMTSTIDITEIFTSNNKNCFFAFNIDAQLYGMLYLRELQKIHVKPVLSLVVL